MNGVVCPVQLLNSALQGCLLRANRVALYRTKTKGRPSFGGGGLVKQQQSSFFFSFLRTVVHSRSIFFCPFAVRRPLPWLGSVAVIIPHKQGTSSLWGRVHFCPPCFFLPWALGKGGAESRERQGDSFISLYNVLLTMCVRLLACVYTHRVTNAVLVGFICWCE